VEDHEILDNKLELTNSFIAVICFVNCLSVFIVEVYFYTPLVL